MFRAGTASAEDGEVGPVEDEATLGVQAPLEVVGERRRGVDHRPAVMAHDVDVVVFGGAVGRCTVVEVGVPHHPDVLEDFERAVHRREVDLGDGVGDLFGRGMPERAHRVEHPLALRSDPQATPVQLLGQIRPGHRGVVMPAHAPMVGRFAAVAQSVLAVLGIGVVDPSTPLVRADDAGVTRGDGCFEGIRVRTDPAGRTVADKLDRHVARMSRSAAALEIAFDEPAWRELVATACAAWTAPAPGEAALKLVLTRGPVATGVPTGYATITELNPDFRRQRREGIRVATLDRGLTSDAFAAAPWLLGGVKTLSYAVNMAAVREAERRGADDAILVSSDRWVLEASTGSVVWATARTLHTTPLAGTGILAGTTQQLLFDHAAEAGWHTADTLARVDDLHAADAVWIISSVRGPVEVIELDGKARARMPEVHAQITALCGFGR